MTELYVANNSLYFVLVNFSFSKTIFCISNKNLELPK